MSKVVLVTDAGGVLGATLARTLADGGHRVFAGVDPQREGYRAALTEHAAYAREHAKSLTGVDLPLGDQRAVEGGVATVVRQAGHIDTVVHVTECAVTGPVESFTAYQLTQMFDRAVLSGQRVNRAVLPHLRDQGSGRILWVNLRPATAGRPDVGLVSGFSALSDRIVAGYADELTPLGVEVCAVTVEVDRILLHPELPADRGVAEAYAAWPESGAPAAAGWTTPAGRPAGTGPETTVAGQDEVVAAAIAQAVVGLLGHADPLPCHVLLDGEGRPVMNVTGRSSGRWRSGTPTRRMGPASSRRWLDCSEGVGD
ncbi:NADP-dependent 3-hydroxy acid dehydrogenase YdfG [Micromonospora violae]|uniref:NADP-dependent 3-hydroxy acid dehydrogenase YdfG n=1 Tax=Micromonospora violae TaxID=1278207 RepID=A0A4Q7UIW8_9ACTN|nr:SDR family NAD(P)-dependent oxidoreductase [Micromonospora violae]RZT79473.1 NADP-dependent 3-hydroxy acid dehydrogenase YdfG [Micromonospora violae]